MPRWQGSTGPAVSTAQTSAGGRLPESGGKHDGLRPAFPGGGKSQRDAGRHAAVPDRTWGRSMSEPAAGKALQVRQSGVLALRPSIGLALGGGGARGLAHILMLEVFDELGLTPKIIAGTSIGALFGAAYASGLAARLIR